MAAKVIIMGAAGKDFHVFNTCYRDREEFEVVAFTATQIPGIDDRRYPAVLAGPLYPDGIPIEPEEELIELIRKHAIDEVVFAYSDVLYSYVEEHRRRVEKAGAKFAVAPVDECMIPSSKPVIAICATRTGCGKSQTTRRVAEVLRKLGKKTAAIRHPMPYGDLSKQVWQRFETLEDLVKHDCTIEEMEEYVPHISSGSIVFAGVDYGEILNQAEKEVDVILWDGGNNDIPFYKPDLFITVTDPHRAGHELTYYPSKENFARADAIIINKMDTAPEGGAATIEANTKEHNPDAVVIKANSPLSVDDESLISGKRVLVVEDGPTLTHGGMKIGAGTVAAKKFGAAEIIDPRPWLVGELKETFEKYPDIGTLLPAMGYSDKQVADLEATINAVECDSVVIGTPIDLARIVKITRPNVRVTYELDDYTRPNVEDLVTELISKGK